MVFRFWRWLSHVGHFCDIWSVSWKSADRGCALIMPNKFQWYIFFENKTYFWKKTKHHQSEPTLPRKVLLNLSSSFFEIFQRNLRNTSHNVATKCCHKMLPSNSLFQDCCELCKWGENTDGRWEGRWQNLCILFLSFGILLLHLYIISFYVFVFVCIHFSTTTYICIWWKRRW